MYVIFRFYYFVTRILDKYRSRYYASIYPGQVFLNHPITFGANSSVSIPANNKNAKLFIGASTMFRKNCSLILDESGSLTIGEGNFFNNGCSISCLGIIEIGDNTLFGEGVKLYDHNHVFNKAGFIIRNQGYTIGQIRIGNNCWIGSNCIILNNVTIGDNVVIGAGCLITASIPSNTVVRLKEQTYSSPLLLRR